MYAETMNSNQKWDVSLTNDFILSIVLDFQEQNFDILTGHENEPIIAFHLSSDDSISQNSDIKSESRGVEMLNGLCDQVWHFTSLFFHDSTWEKL